MKSHRVAISSLLNGPVISTRRVADTRGGSLFKASMSPSSIAKAWRQFWCLHRFYIEQIESHVIGEREYFVTCPCYKCHKLFTADYGLALPGSFDRKPEKPA